MSPRPKAKARWPGGGRTEGVDMVGVGVVESADAAVAADVFHCPDPGPSNSREGSFGSGILSYVSCCNHRLRTGPCRWPGSFFSRGP